MNQPLRKGKLLVAMPALNDPHFMQAVVLLCNYGSEGALGVILNRPTEIAVSTLIHDFPALAGANRIYEGGPVAKNGMLVLCRGQGSNPDNEILQDISLAKDLDALKGMDATAPDMEVRCYLGYAGWVPGQLEAELHTGSWKTVPADATLIFETDPLLLWPRMIRELGPEYAFYATMPMNPGMN